MFKNLSIGISGTCLLIFASLRGVAQNEAASNVQTKLEKYSQAYLKEKVYLHTDKDYYLAGEVIWFKVYYVNGSTHQPIDLSQVVYVEVLDRSSKPVLQAKIPVTSQGGQGSFYLPLTLRSDQYSLRAYTSWMKNAGSGVFFEKNLSILNTLKQLEPGMQAGADRVTAEFFPEGGYLVQDIETKLAFRCVNQYGKGVSVNGVIVSDLGDTISRFSPQHSGIGAIPFKPAPGRQYKSMITTPDGQSYVSALPSVYASGYVMNVSDNKDGRIQVRVQAKKANATDRGERVFLLVHTRQVTKKLEYGFVNYETDLVFYLDKSLLGEGVSHFTLFTEALQPVAERLFFKRPVSKQPLAVNADRNEYGRREQVKLAVQTRDNIDSATYSMAIIQQDALQHIGQNDILSYLWLVSDLRGDVESPAYYLNESAEAEQAADNLMLTHGWRRFRWDNLFAVDKSGMQLNSIPEFKGHVIKAKVTNSDGKAAGAVDCYLSFPAAPFGLYIGKTDSTGMVYFDIEKYYGPGEIIVQADPFGSNNYVVDVQTPFSDEQLLNALPALKVSKEQEKVITQKSIAMQAQNLYRPDSIRRFSLPGFNDTMPFFGKPEYSYQLDLYKRFTTMEEVLREYVSSINVGMHNGKPSMTIWDEEYENIYKDNILVLLDGVPLKEYNKIFSYDPMKIKKLDVVPRRYLMGPLIFSGIASFETYGGKFDGFEMEPGIIAVDYEGLQLQREFYSPNYANTEQHKNRIPDLRTTLYWNPAITTDAQGKAALNLYTSDQKGKFLIVIQGLDKKGEAMTAVSSFEVK